MIRFDVLQPKTIPEAIQMLNQHGSSARALAGGTDLLVAMKLRHQRPRYLVNLKGLSGMRGIAWHEGKGLRIGALTRIRELVASALIGEHFPVLQQAAGALGSVQVRNLATVGGNLCNASPSADTAPALMALDAQVCIFGSAGERRVPLEAFFAGPGRTMLRPAELLTEIWVPSSAPRSGGCYVKHGSRKSMDCAVVGVAVRVSLQDSTTRCGEARIVLGAVAPTPVRATAAEDMLQERELSESLVQQAAEAAVLDTRPISDLRGSACYRQDLVPALVGRAIREAWAAAGGVQLG
jgi:carbon-monoxide dehydrogenase medium subunit